MPITTTAAAAILIAATGPCLAETPAAAPATDLSADAPQAPADTVRLSPDQREAALEYGATRALREPPINGLDHKIHGEMGIEVGSNGSRAMYGTATVPLGDSGSATVSFLNANSGHYRYHY